MITIDRLWIVLLSLGALAASTYVLARLRRGRRVSGLRRRLSGSMGEYHLFVHVAFVDLDNAFLDWRRLFEPARKTSVPATTEAEQSSPAQPGRFLVDSLVLFESFRHVCPADSSSPGIRFGHDGLREIFHYATGLQVDSQTFIISHIVPVQYSSQSAGGARVSNPNNIETLAWLDEVGLPLIAHFHSHPGFGREASHASSVDHRFQERLERGGHFCIGGIFSRDGFLRFFAGDPSRFQVEVQGSHVEKVDENVYRLSLADRPFPISATVSR